MKCIIYLLLHINIWSSRHNFGSNLLVSQKHTLREEKNLYTNSAVVFGETGTPNCTKSPSWRVHSVDGFSCCPLTKVPFKLWSKETIIKPLLFPVKMKTTNVMWSWLFRFMYIFYPTPSVSKMCYNEIITACSYWAGSVVLALCPGLAFLCHDSTGF